MSQDAVKEVVGRMLEIARNIDLMYNDVDRLLGEAGFSRLHTGFYAEGSRQKVVYMLPHYVSAFYGCKDDEEETEGHYRRCISVCVSLTDDGEAAEPIIIYGVVIPRNSKVPYYGWWPATAARGTRAVELEVQGLPEGFMAKGGYPKSMADYWFERLYYATVPLTDVGSTEDLDARVIKPLLQLYEAVSQVEERSQQPA